MGYYINPGYEEHINQYNVLSLDITGFMGGKRIMRGFRRI